MSLTTDRKNDPRLNKLFDEAVRYRDAGRYDLAVEKLREIISLHPDYGAVFGVLGNVYWDMNDLPSAVKCFERAVELLPRSESASLGLFHTRLESGNEEDAFSEMRRFLATSSSEEYDRLLRELSQE